jgi:Tfp pilus assembly protein PilF
VTETSSALLARAQALIEVHRYDDALLLLGEGLGRDPENYAMQTALARALLLVGRSKDAEKAAERAALLEPSEPEPHCIRAEALLPLGDANREADDAAKRACELGPTYPRAFFVRVRTALAVGLRDDAWTAANRVLELRPHASLGHHARGLVLIEREDWDAVEEEYRAALAISPNDPNLLNNYGLALLNHGRETEAIDQFTRAGALDARRDVFRKNTAVAARRHLGDVRRPGRLRPRGGLTGVIVFWLVLIVLLAVAPTAAAIMLIGGALIAPPLLVVRRRRRLRRLPSAARIAMEIDERTGENSYGYRRPVPTRVVVVVIAGVILVGIAMFIGDVNHSPSPTVPLPTLDPSQARCIEAALREQVDQTVTDTQCPSPSTTVP